MRIILSWSLCLLVCAALPVLPLSLGESPLSTSEFAASIGNCSQVRQTSTRAEKIEVLGAFSNIKHIGDHVYGYTLELWQQGSNLFGLFVSQSGQTGDPPIGLLEDVRFSRKTKRLSFRARLTTGLISKGNLHLVPSRDIFYFSGVLARNKIMGTLKISNALFPDEPPAIKRITLSKSAAMTQVMLSPGTYDEWKSWSDDILRRRGPKW